MAPKTNHIKYKWIHVHALKMAPKSDQMKLKRIHEHVLIAEMAPKNNHTKSNWIYVRVTRIKIAPKSNQMKLKWIHSLEHTQIAKIASKNNNTTLLTLNFSLFMIHLNLPIMSGGHENKKTTDHNWIPIRNNHWHTTHISIEKYQNIAKLELVSSHNLQNQHTIYPRDRTWSFTYALFFYVQTEGRP